MHLTRFSLAWVSSVQLAASRIFGILAAVLIDRFSCRTVAVVGSALAAIGCLTASFAPSLVLFICLYSLVSGVGYALLFTSSIVVVTQHWRPLGYLPIANAFAMSGMGVGAIAFGPISRGFIGSYDWRSYLRFLAASFGGILALTLLYKRPVADPNTTNETQINSNPVQKRKILDVSLLKNPSLVLFMVAIVIMFLGLSAPFVHMVSDSCIFFLPCMHQKLSSLKGSICPRLVFVSSRSRLSRHLFRYRLSRRSHCRRIYRKSSSSRTDLSLSLLHHFFQCLGCVRTVDWVVRRTGRLCGRLRFFSWGNTLLWCCRSGNRCAEEGTGSTGSRMVFVFARTFKRIIGSYCRFI